MSTRDPQTVRATFAAYLYALNGDGDDQPLAPSWRPMSLNDALAILAGDLTPRGKKRTQRVATRFALSAPSDVRSRALQAVGLQVDSIDKSLAKSVSNWPHLQEHSGVPSPQNPGAKPKVWDPALPRDDQHLLTETAVKIGEMLGITNDQGCTASFPVPDLKVDLLKGSVTLRASLVVNRSVGELKVVFDPRNWDGCSDFFVDTHRVKSIDDPLEHIADQDPPVLGYDMNGLLFEQFAAILGDNEVSAAEVILDFQVANTPTTYSVTYKLAKPLKVQLCGKTVDGDSGKGIVVDDGSITVVQEAAPATGCTVRIVKEIKITGFGLANHLVTCWAGVYLLMISDELFHFSCCRHP